MTASNRPYQKNTTGEKIVKTRLYGIWCGIHDRCTNPNNKEYHRYGERGITVCEAWNHDNPNGYMNFREWSLANGYADNLTIDRIDPNGNYDPMNCRWSSMKEQQRNRTDNHPIVVNGTTYGSIAEAIEALGREADSHTIKTRIYRGMTPQEAFDKTLGQGNKGKSITIDGKTYKSLVECCRAYGLDYNTVQIYKRRHRFTLEEAIHHYKNKEN